MMVTFKSDVSKRKKMFTPESFAHPAKMHLGMLLWIVGKYSKPGDTVLDPMFGSGSTMLAARYGRNVIGVELEQKFVDIAAGFNCNGQILGYRDIWVAPVEAGWLVYCGSEAIEHLFSTKEEAEAFYADWEFKGAARDNGIQWQEAKEGYSKPEVIPAQCGRAENHEPHYVSGNWDKVKALPKTKYGLGDCQIIQGDARDLEGLLVDSIITSPPYAEINQMPRKNPDPTADKQGRGNIGKQYSDNPSNIGNIPYGEVDAVITSPPYEATFNEKQHTLSGIAKRDPSMRTEVGGYSGKVDAVISSPPYEGSLQGDVEDKISSGFNSPQAIKMMQGLARGYSKEPDNIGNLRKETYLTAMLQVYRACHSVLKPRGLMVLVTKDFIRKGQRILLSIDTIALCEQAGFAYEDWHQRKLTQQSFWRTLYYQKHPEVEKLDTEDILVFRKLNGKGVVDAVITSPPFKEQMQDTKWMMANQPRAHRGAHNPKEQDAGNIGNLPYNGAEINDKWIKSRRGG